MLLAGHRGVAAPGSRRAFFRKLMTVGNAS
jgi:hypothetical protein